MMIILIQIKRILKRISYLSTELLFYFDKKNSNRIKKLKNYHCGQRCFLIGSGPSIKGQDLSLLKDEITFGFNAFFLIEEEVGFLPTYYLIEDPFPAEDNEQEINKLENTNIIVPKNLKYCIKPKKNVTYVNFDRTYINPEHNDFPFYSNDALRKVYWGGTVAYMALQLADYMGFSEVYLLGIDLTYSWPKDHNSDSLKSEGDDQDHFHPDYFGKGKRWHDPKVDRMQKAFDIANKMYIKSGKKLYNATYGGNLKNIERVDFQNIFKEENK